jgi:hypothetical protein
MLQKHKPKPKYKTHVAKKPPSRKVKHMAKAPKNTPKGDAPIIDLPDEVVGGDTEIARLRSVIEQVDVDIEAGQIATAHARIKAALIHGNEPEPEPQESK